MSQPKFTFSLYTAPDTTLFIEMTGEEYTALTIQDARELADTLLKLSEELERNNDH